MTNGLALTRIEGSVPERLDAFRNLSAALGPQTFFAGYDTPAKGLQACWAADALGVHPAAFMQGVHVADFRGRIMLEPKWEFINGLLRSRLPGFDIEVHEETAEACDLTLHAEGRRSQRVRYAMQDAIRQGLAGPGGRNQATYEKNANEMLFKQAFKRAADRLASDVLMGLPTATSFEDLPGAPADASGAEVVDETPKPEPRAARREEQRVEAAAAPVREALDSALSGTDWLATLSAEIDRIYGARLGRAKKLEKCAFLYGQATGLIVQYQRADQIPPAEARKIVEYIRENNVGHTLKPAENGGGGTEAVANQQESPPAKDNTQADEDLARAFAEPEPEPAKPIDWKAAFFEGAQKTGVASDVQFDIVSQSGGNWEQAYRLLDAHLNAAVAS